MSAKRGEISGVRGRGVQPPKPLDKGGISQRQLIDAGKLLALRWKSELLFYRENISSDGTSPFGDFLFYSVRNELPQAAVIPLCGIIYSGTTHPAQFPPIKRGVPQKQPPAPPLIRGMGRGVLNGVYNPRLKHSGAGPLTPLTKGEYNFAGGHNCLYSTGSFSVCSPASIFKICCIAMRPLQNNFAGTEVNASTGSHNYVPAYNFRQDAEYTSTGSVFHKSSCLSNLQGGHGSYSEFIPTEASGGSVKPFTHPYNSADGHGRQYLYGEEKRPHIFVVADQGRQLQRLWQPNYYEHIIRNENALGKIRGYIQNSHEAEKIDWKELEEL